MNPTPFILAAFALGVVVGILGARRYLSAPARHATGEPAPVVIARRMRLTRLDADARPSGEPVDIPSMATVTFGHNSGNLADLELDEPTQSVVIDWRDGAPRCGRPGCDKPELDVTITGDPQGVKYCSMLCAHADAFRYTPVHRPADGPLAAHPRSWDDLYDGPPEEVEHG